MIAIIGAEGQLGSDLVKAIDTPISLSSRDIDVCDLSSCVNVLEKRRPNIVINCAAYVRVDDAEDFPEKALKVNALGARNVAIACEKINAINVYISTDYVFDGEKKQYVESDNPNPINTYGISKYAGELFTKNISSKFYIVRTASLFGFAGASGKGGNFIETMIMKAKELEDIKVVTDIIISPTYTKDLAFQIRQLIEEHPPGIYHCANDGSCSWNEFTRAIYELMGLDVQVSSIKSKEVKSKAKRPSSSVLSTEKLKPMRHWRDALKEYLRERGHLR